MTASCDYLDIVFSAVSRVDGPLTREAFVAALTETEYEAAHGSLVKFTAGDPVRLGQLPGAERRPRLRAQRVGVHAPPHRLARTDGGRRHRNGGNRWLTVVRFESGAPPLWWPYWRSPRAAARVGHRST